MTFDDCGFYFCSEKGPFVVGSKTVMGRVKSEKTITIPEISLQKEDFQEKLLRFVVSCNLFPVRKENEDKPSCCWVGGVFHYSGYGSLNRHVIRELLKMGTNIKLITVVESIDIPLDEALFIAKNASCQVSDRCPIVWGKVQTGNTKRRSVHYTMSETEGEVNWKFQATLFGDDEIWVPTQWNKENFLKSGILQGHIEVIPLGVDENLYKPSSGEVFYTSGANKFVFLSVSSWNWRKGHDVLLKAYSRAFSSKDDVSLVFLTREGEVKRDVDGELRKIVADLKKENAPHVVLSKARISEEAMPYIYSNANVFILMSRGEGWGLPYCEAAACGLPIIATGSGGQMAFLRDEDSFLVKPDRIVDADPSMTSWSEIYEGTKFFDFSDNAIDEIARKMRWVYENYGVAKKRSESCFQRISTQFTWKNCAKKVYNRLIEIQ